MSNLANNTVTMEEILALVQSLPEGGGGGFPNGTEWTQSNITSGAVTCFCYANGTWVAGGDVLRYSTDGKTWITCTSLSSWYEPEGIVSIAYAKGLWMAASSSLGLWYSTNGVEWDIYPDSDYSTFEFVICENGTWMAMCDGGSTAWTSEDGTSWDVTNMPFERSVRRVLYAGGKFIAVTNSGPMYYSLDGASWTEVSGLSSVFWADYGSGLFVAASSRSGLHYSNDGINWTQSNVTSNHLCVHHANGKWVAGGRPGITLKYSADGKVWSESNVVSGAAQSIVHSNGMWVAGGSQGGLWYSADGEVWTQSNITGNMQYVYNANGIWVAGSAGTEGIVYSVGWEQS